ncbi:MAG: nucleotidyltransferase domain-containing protein [Chloroflexota bacterium]|nr:nucleotidyltransferase domain-containing protein [Chloroflexota bacterium]
MNGSSNFSDDAISAYRRAFEERERQKMTRRERRRLEALAAIEQAVRVTASSYPAIRRVYLFGSITRPSTFRSSSDIDVAVEGLGAGRCFDLWRDLERAAPGWTLDVRSLRQRDYFSDRIRERGMVVYER